MDNKETHDNLVANKLSKKSKKFWIILGALVLVLIIIIIISAQSQENNPGSKINQKAQKSFTSEGTSTASAVVDIKNDKNLTPAPIATTTNLNETQIANLKTAKVVVPGANPITEDNVVITPKGEVTNTSVRSISANAPKQTGFLNKDTLPETLTKLTIADGKFTPNTLTTTAGAPTSFALTSGDSYVHVLNFEDPLMKAIVILVGPGQTKAITFNAPVAGSYVFHDSTPGSTAQGTLIVK